MFLENQIKTGLGPNVYFLLILSSATLLAEISEPILAIDSFTRFSSEGPCLESLLLSPAKSSNCLDFASHLNISPFYLKNQDQLVLQDSNKNLLFLQKSTLKVQNNYQMKAFLSTRPLLHQEHLILTNKDGLLIWLSLKDHSTQTLKLDSEVSMPLRLDARNNRLVAYTEKGTLYFINHSKREIETFYKFDREHAMALPSQAAPVLAKDGKLLVATSDGSIKVLSTSTKEYLESLSPFNGDAQFPGIVADIKTGKYIYIASHSEGLVALNKKSLKPVFRKSLANISALLLYAGTIIAITPQKVTAFSEDGKELWKNERLGLIGSPTRPILLKDLLVFGKRNEGIFVLDLLKEGRQVQHLAKGASFRGDLEPHENGFWAISEKGTLFDFQFAKSRQNTVLGKKRIHRFPFLNEV